MLGKKIYSMNKNWKFQKHQNSTNEISDNDFDMFSGYTKTGAMLGPASDGFCDSDWQTVQLPHDWLVSEPFDENGCQGSKPRGAAWYRKWFFIPSEWDGKRLFFRFDGISAKSIIFLNNIRICISESAYTEIFVEITELLHYGQPNLVSVYTDNFSSEGWWYDGCGIYRNTWLIVSEKTKFANHGIFVSANRTGNNDWNLNVCVETEEPSDGQTITVEAHGNKETMPANVFNKFSLNIENPPVWDFDNPTLIPVDVILRDEDGTVLDSERIMFGFREVEFNTEKGCCLNGIPTKLKGVCLHHDHAAVGVAMTYEIQRYRLRKLKEMGCNAIRTSHNPQSPEFYRVCDELGFAVMDEVRHFGAAEEELRQLRSMVRRDRNHPCVFFWSMFNEEPLQCSKIGERMAAKMKSVIFKEDSTRPVSGGMNGPLEADGAVNVVDIMGFNYLQYAYDEFHKIHPNMPIVGSETVSHLTQRDSNNEGKSEIELRRTAYGQQRTNDFTGFKNLYKWSETTGDAWKSILDRNFVSGGFLWTGIDYRGEATWPGVIADFGAMDICCFPKDNFYWNQAMWKNGNVLNTTRYETDNGNAKLFCYSNAERFDIIQENTTLEINDYDIYQPEAYVVSAQKDIIVKGYFKNGEILQRELKPFSAPYELKLVSENDSIVQNGIAVFNVYLLDKNGNICKEANCDVRFSVFGGTVVGVNNGDTSSHETEITDSCRLFHGCAQAIVRAGSSEKMEIKAVCKGLEASVIVQTEESGVQFIESCEEWLRIYPWRMSDISENYPAKELLHNMMYNWIPTMVGAYKSEMMSDKFGYACFAGNFTAPHVASEIHLNDIVGVFDLYLNGEKILSCEDESSHNHIVCIPDRFLGKRCGLSLVFTCKGGQVSVGEIYICVKK